MATMRIDEPAALPLDEIARLVSDLAQIEKNRVARAVRIGRLLRQAKEQLAHGEWLPFVVRCGLSPRTAQSFMAIAKVHEAGGPDADRIMDMKMRDVQKMLSTPRRQEPEPPIAFPTGNVDRLPAACPTCGRSCECAPAFVIDDDEEEAA